MRSRDWISDVCSPDLIGWATRTSGRDGKYESAFDLDTYKKVLEVNRVGTFNGVRLAATAMSQTEPLADNEKGAIVTVASVAAFDGQIGQVAYSASKGGVVGKIGRASCRERVCQYV